MPVIQHILFPFDFSQPSVLAASFVRAAADAFQANVTLLSVVPPMWDTPPVGMPVLAATDPDEIEKDLKGRLDAALPELVGPCVQRRTDYGDPAMRIVDFAHSNAVDLIMMPTHGFGVFRNLLLGSVTAKVLHDARCPVWTATHAEEQNSSNSPKTILCAVDGTPKTTTLIGWAAEFSRGIGAALQLVHVAPSVSDWLTISSERELQEHVRADAHKNIQGFQQEAGTNFPLRVAVGQIADAVTEEARQEQADLLIIGRGLLQSPLGRIRTHTYSMIQKSPCPVVSV
jgi:nucleotide-binding universal stress UspA family protein